MTLKTLVALLKKFKPFICQRFELLIRVQQCCAVGILSNAMHLEELSGFAMGKAGYCAMRNRGAIGIAPIEEWKEGGNRAHVHAIDVDDGNREGKSEGVCRSHITRR